MTPAAGPRIDDQADVLIIGGGIIGCSAAYYLSAAGVDVLLVERFEINREASGTNAGNLHFQIARHSSYDPDQVERIRAKEAIHAESVRLWRSLEGELGTDLGVRMRGGLVVAETPDEFERLQAKAQIERSIGLETEILSTAEVRDIAPQLSDRLMGAAYCPDEGFANPLVVAPAFARRAMAMGARIRIGTDVTGIEPETAGGFTVMTSTGRIRAKRVVNAAGAWAGNVGRLAGAPVPATGHSLHVMASEPAPFGLKQLVQHIGRRLTLKQTQYGTYIIGGGWPGRWAPDIDRKKTLWESLVGNLHVACRVVPELADVRIVRSWGGMIGTTPGHMPIIGETRVPGFWVVMGGSAFTTGPVQARLLAEMMTTGKPSLPVEHFDPSRFDGTPVH